MPPATTLWFLTCSLLFCAPTFAATVPEWKADDPPKTLHLVASHSKLPGALIQYRTVFFKELMDPRKAAHDLVSEARSPRLDVRTRHSVATGKDVNRLHFKPKHLTRARISYSAVHSDAAQRAEQAIYEVAAPPAVFTLILAFLSPLLRGEYIRVSQPRCYIRFPHARYDRSKPRVSP